MNSSTEQTLAVNPGPFYWWRRRAVGSVLRISAVVLLTISAELAIAQVSPERRQAILDYQLNLPRANQLIPAMATMTKYVVSLPDFQDCVRKAAKMTPAEGLAAIEPKMDAADGIGSAGKQAAFAHSGDPKIEVVQSHS